MMHQSSEGWRVSGPGEGEQKTEWIIVIHDHSFAVVGSRVDI